MSFGGIDGKVAGSVKGSLIVELFSPGGDGSPGTPEGKMVPFPAYLLIQ